MKKSGFFGLLVIILALFFTGCDMDGNDIPTDEVEVKDYSDLRWRAELMVDSVSIGSYTRIWSLNHASYAHFQFFNPYTNNYPSDASIPDFEAGYSGDYILVSKDDKPAGEISSFTVTDKNKNVSFTFKYILSESEKSFELIDNGGFNNRKLGHYY